MHPSPDTHDGATSQWGEKAAPSWLSLIALTLGIFAPILLIKGIGTLLPEPSEVLKPTTVTLGDPEGWTLTLTNPEGEALACLPDSAVFLEGWDCEGTRIMAHSIATPHDPVLATRRIIRAGNLSDLPEGTVTREGNTTIVTLSEDESARIANPATPGHIIEGLLVADPEGSPGDSIIVTLDGPAHTVKQLSDQIVKGADK